MFRKTIVCLSMLAGLMLTSCEHYIAQPNEQQKKYADDRSVCAALAQQVTQNPEAFNECMTARGWTQQPARRL
jgi:hypothetical protein